VHPTLGILARFQAFFHASAFSQSDGVPPPAPARVTQTVVLRRCSSCYVPDYRRCLFFAQWGLSFSEADFENITCSGDRAMTFFPPAFVTNVITTPKRRQSTNAPRGFPTRSRVASGRCPVYTGECGKVIRSLAGQGWTLSHNRPSFARLVGFDYFGRLARHPRLRYRVALSRPAWASIRVACLPVRVLLGQQANEPLCQRVIVEKLICRNAPNRRCHLPITPPLVSDVSLVVTMAHHVIPLHVQVVTHGHSSPLLTSHRRKPAFLALSVAIWHSTLWVLLRHR